MTRWVYTVCIMVAGREAERLSYQTKAAARRVASRRCRALPGCTGAVMFRGTPSTGYLAEACERLERRGQMPPRLDGRPHDPEFLQMYAPRHTAWVNIGARS